jgi:hypothetical protein
LLTLQLGHTHTHTQRFYAQALTQEWAGAVALKPRVPAFSALKSTILQNGVTVSTSDDLSPTTNVFGWFFSRFFLFFF